MKRSIKIFSAALLSLAGLWSCSEWTKPESLDFEPGGLDGSANGDEYYENLRAWKAARTIDENGVPSRPVTFGWFSDWSPSGADMSKQMMGIPDSVDFISLWGNWKDLSDAAKEDMNKVQTIKGTKVLLCFIVDNIGAQTTPEFEQDEAGKYIVNGKKFDSREEALGEFWGWYHDMSYAGNKVYGDASKMEEAIRKYAKSIVDTIGKYGYDGFDYDLEPNVGSAGNIASYPERITIFLDELSKSFGPKSGTGKLLCVDGEPYVLEPECVKMLDHFILQAYGDRSTYATDDRVNALITRFSSVLSKEAIVGMTILTSNYESYGSTGGPTYTLANGEQTFQTNAFAQYTYPGVKHRIGGIGAFRMIFDKGYTHYREAMKTLHSPLAEDLWRKVE